MNIEAIENRYRIKVKPSKVLINRLQTRIKGFEHTYNMPSAQMLAIIQKDTAHDTEEIGRWMQDYLVLERISNGANGKTPTDTAGTL
jgi:hypothetical protein